MAERVYRSVTTGLVWTIDLDAPGMHDGTRKAIRDRIARGQMIDLGEPQDQDSQEF